MISRRHFMQAIAVAASTPSSVLAQERANGANGFGKLKMIVQSCAVGGLILLEAYAWGDAWYRALGVLVTVLVWLTLLATVGSGVTYVLKTRAILAEVNE